jgi:Flp pilus assembly secretin CpaC
MRNVLIIVVSAFLFCGIATADEPSPPSDDLAASVVASNDDASQIRLNHLRSAAEHLSKAGMKDEADKLREQIAAMEQGQAEALLARKEMELNAVRAEVDRLRKLIGREQQIELFVQVFEASRARLKDVDIQNVRLLFPEATHPMASPRAVHEAGELAETIEGLRQKNLIRVLAEPTMVTLGGRPVSFNSGGEVPIVVPQGTGVPSIEYKRYGTGFDAVALPMGNGKVQLEVRARISELDPSRGVSVGGSKIPGFRERVVDTAAELRFGEVLVLNGPKQSRVETQKDSKGKLREVVDEIDMIVLTPKQLGPIDPVRNAKLERPVNASYVDPGNRNAIKQIDSPAPRK